MKSKMKKLVSLVLAMAMVFTMSAVVFADSTGCDITISGAADKSKYTAYKLMDVTISGDNYSYTVNGTYSSILSGVLSEIGTNYTDVAEYLDSIKDDTAAVRTFADKVYTAINTAGSLGTEGTDYYTATADSSGATITSVAQGYYLIVETAAASSNDSISLVMLNTAGESGVTVTTKEDVPEMTKKIKDTNDSTGVTSVWQDSADYDIGDHVPYQLTATLPSTLASYDTYKLIFHDDMESGLTFDSSSVVVYVYTYNELTSDYDSEVVESGYDVVTGSSLTDTCDFEVQIADVNKLTGSSDIISVSSTSKIVVEYTATLNSGAVIGNPGNWNTALLEYSNNPYASGSGDNHETGKTPEDTVVALTYDVIVNKIDENKDALAGAEFKLEKYVNGSWVEKELVKNTAGTTFSFTGLDDGWYKITETTTPQGYNSIDPIYFIVTGTHTETINAYTNTPLTALDYSQADWNDTESTASASASATTIFTAVCTKANTTDYLASTNIVNKSGSVLPSTGGIGTTIFYIVGAVLVLGAGVILVTRRRTRA